MNTWKTKEGEEIPIHQMGDSHLLNAYRMLERKGYCELSAYCSPPPNGDMALMEWERFIMEANPHPAMDDLREEIEIRGLSL